MSVYLVYRNPHESPLGRRIVKFRDRNLLDWFQRNWIRLDELSDYEKSEFENGSLFFGERTEALFSGFVEGFNGIWKAMLKKGDPPKTERQLKSWLEKIGLPRVFVAAGGHAWQAEVEGCEINFVAMMFDDDHIKKHPERTDFLVRKQQKLPTKISADPKRFRWNGRRYIKGQKGKQPGAVYAIVMVIEDNSFITPPECVFQFKGVRLPGFVNYLQGEQPAPTEDGHLYSDRGCWPKELRMLRWFAIKNSAKTSLKKSYRKCWTTIRFPMQIFMGT